MVAGNYSNGMTVEYPNCKDKQNSHTTMFSDTHRRMLNLVPDGIKRKQEWSGGLTKRQFRAY